MMPMGHFLRSSGPVFLVGPGAAAVVTAAVVAAAAVAAVVVGAVVAGWVLARVPLG